MQKQHGFTLIEIAIVLVIIGLLLGQQTDILEDFDHIFVVGGHCPEKGRVVWAKFDISLS